MMNFLSAWKLGCLPPVIVIFLLIYYRKFTPSFCATLSLCKYHRLCMHTNNPLSHHNTLISLLQYSYFYYALYDIYIVPADFDLFTLWSGASFELLILLYTIVPADFDLFTLWPGASFGVQLPSSLNIFP